MPETKINPYNFVPLGKKPDRVEWENIFKHHLLREESYSGHLKLRFRTITPLFIPSYAKGDVEGNQNTPQTFKRYIHRDGKPIIPGSSIKGMIRSVFEALTNSCMVLFAETYSGIPYPSNNYKNKDCNTANGLCPACSVFGTICGEDMAFQGKVQFTDAIGIKDDLEEGEWNLKELSAPKPERHSPFYAKDGKNPSSGPRGRKFYFHHDPRKVTNEEDYITQNIHNIRNKKIKERLKAGANLYSSMSFYGLTERELSALLFTLELGLSFVKRNEKMLIERQMAHKIGMGKPIGLGSIGILITGGTITKGTERYRSVKEVSQPNFRDQINKLTSSAPSPARELSDLLSLHKYEQGNIEYPPHNWFAKGHPLGILGEFNGPKPTTSSKTNLNVPLAEAEAPIESPPSNLAHGEKAVWLKKRYKDLLIFVDLDGKETKQKPNVFQGKKELLEVGKWYRSKGTKSVWPLQKR